MTREHAQELREVFNAFCDGKKIEYYSHSQWLPICFPEWNDETKYRIKPRAVEVTREKLAEAWNEVSNLSMTIKQPEDSGTFKALCRALRLED